MAEPRLVRSLLAAMAADTSLPDKLRAERNTLAYNIATDASYGRTVTNGSGNGMAFTAEVEMTHGARLALLQAALDCYDNSLTPSSFAPVSFC